MRRRGAESTSSFRKETEEDQARACTPKRRGESALRSVKASREDAEWLIRKFKERYEIKTQMIGEAADLDKQLQILNRTVRWSSRDRSRPLKIAPSGAVNSLCVSGQCMTTTVDVE